MDSGLADSGRAKQGQETYTLGGGRARMLRTRVVRAMRESMAADLVGAVYFGFRLGGLGDG